MANHIPNRLRIEELFYKIEYLPWTSSMFVKIDGNMLLVIKYLNKTQVERLRKQLLGIFGGIWLKGYHFVLDL